VNIQNALSTANDKVQNDTRPDTKAVNKSHFTVLIS